MNNKDLKILRKKWKIADLKVLLDQDDIMVFNAKKAKYYNLNSNDLKDKIKLYLSKELKVLEKELDEIL